MLVYQGVSKRGTGGTGATGDTSLSPLHRSMAGRRDSQQALRPGQPLPWPQNTNELVGNAESSRTWKHSLILDLQIFAV